MSIKQASGQWPVNRAAPPPTSTYRCLFPCRLWRAGLSKRWRGRPQARSRARGKAQRAGSARRRVLLLPLAVLWVHVRRRVSPAIRDYLHAGTRALHARRQACVTAVFSNVCQALLTFNVNSARKANESMPLPGNMMSERDCLNLSVYTPKLDGCAPVSSGCTAALFSLAPAPMASTRLRGGASWRGGKASYW